ncbi:MAG: cell cycle transcriptional regulator TrcR, partial [Rhodospirillaceae bacterium]
MPKATAVWLVENTTLTFEQIAEFCGMHELEIQAIADGEVAVGITGQDPISTNQLTQEELDRCQADPNSSLRIRITENPIPQARQKGSRYTPVSKRHDRPDGIAWILKNHPEVTDAQICKLLGTTKPTIQAVRDRSHWNSPNIKPRNPV